MLFRATRRALRSRRVRSSRCAATRRSRASHNTVLMPIGGMQRAVVEALRYAETLSDDVRAVYVDVEPGADRTAAARLGQRGAGACKLVVLPSPFRSLMEPLLEYIEQVEQRAARRLRDRDPAGVRARRAGGSTCFTTSALLIKGALLFRPNIVVTSVPFHLSR